MNNGIERFGLKVRNLKCFCEAQGFDTIKSINIIIGRNSVGKSTLLDLVELVVQEKKKTDHAISSTRQSKSVDRRR